MDLDASDMSPEEALAALAWQVELGADEAMAEAPVDRFVVAEAPLKTAPGVDPQLAPAAQPMRKPEPVATPVSAASQALVAGCHDLEALRAAMGAFEGCALKKGARNLVFADGVPGARVMIVGEAPGREEDAQALPFVGASGQLLDKMFASIGLSRKAENPAEALYITNTIPWRPPQNRDPSADEIAMMMPFLERHIALAAPDVLITMGNSATKTLLATTTGITRMRGTWVERGGIPVLPMFHPAALLRDPLKKREAWADLKAVRARLS